MSDQVVRLTAQGLRQIFPKAIPGVIDAFVRNQYQLDRAGITATRRRLGFFLANVGHETDGFTIKNLTESMAYTHERAAAVWPARFDDAWDVARRFGTEPGWQYRMFDEVYGGRMGNKPGTNDGSRFIGRGGPQITGREGYRVVGARAGLPLEDSPELACKPENQPAIGAAFWDWKGLSVLADANDFLGVVRRWNGGTNGLADRQNRLARYMPVIDGMPMGAPSAAPKKPNPTPAAAAVVVGAGTVAAGSLLGNAAALTTDSLHIAVVAAVAIVTAGLIYLVVRRLRG